jgi:hypothetical protein
MLWRNVLAEKGRFLECDCRDCWVICEVVLFSHCLVLDQRAILLEQTSMVSLWSVKRLSMYWRILIIPDDLETLHSSFLQVGDLLGRSGRELPAHRL